MRHGKWLELCAVGLGCCAGYLLLLNGKTPQASHALSSPSLLPCRLLLHPNMPVKAPRAFLPINFPCNLPAIYMYYTSYYLYMYAGTLFFSLYICIFNPLSSHLLLYIYYEKTWHGMDDDRAEAGQEDRGRDQGTGHYTIHAGHWVTWHGWEGWDWHGIRVNHVSCPHSVLAAFPFSSPLPPASQLLSQRLCHITHLALPFSPTLPATPCALSSPRLLILLPGHACRQGVLSHGAWTCWLTANLFLLLLSKAAFRLTTATLPLLVWHPSVFCPHTLHAHTALPVSYLCAVLTFSETSPASACSLPIPSLLSATIT